MIHELRRGAPANGKNNKTNQKDNNVGAEMLQSPAGESIVIPKDFVRHPLGYTHAYGVKGRIQG
jgi:hypothetical protein